MNLNLPHLQMPQMIPVNSAAITISTCCAEEADELTSLKDYFKVHNHLFALLSDDDHENIINWYDGRPKSMFLTLWTGNNAAIQYALAEDLLDEELTLQTALRDYLASEGVCCDCAEAILSESMPQNVKFKQQDSGRLVVDCGTALTGK